MSAQVAVLPIAFLLIGAVILAIIMFRSVTTTPTKTLAPTPGPLDEPSPRVLNLTRAPSLFSAGDTPSPFSRGPSRSPITGATRIPSLNPTERARSPSFSPTRRPLGSVTGRPSRSPSTVSQGSLRKQNVLLIVVDDLGGAIGSFGDADARTPNIDTLGNRGLRFVNHHVSMSECAPSRASLLSGKRPDQLQLYAGAQYFRSKNANLMTMPAHFRRSGYRTIAIGRVFDRASFPPSPSLMTDLCGPGQDSSATTCSFDEEIPATSAVGNLTVCPLGASLYPPNPGMSETLLVYGEALSLSTSLTDRFTDACLARHVQYKVDELAWNTSRPFFLTVGFTRPRPPWSVPRESWDAFPSSDEEAFADRIWSQDISGSFFTSESSDASRKVGWSEISAFSDAASVPERRRPRGYYASVSHVDVMVGRVARTISTHPSQIIRENTIVVVWGDNGLHLGPLLWGPRTIFEQATRTPLIIVPSVNWRRTYESLLTGIGQTVDWPVETVDVYPTLVQMANVPDFDVAFTGKSLVTYFFDRTIGHKAVAVSQCLDQRATSTQTSMGYALRSRNYRLIRYFSFDADCYSASDRTACAFSNTPTTGIRSELYYYSLPGGSETVNVYDDPAHASARNLLVAIMDARDPAWAQV